MFIGAINSTVRTYLAAHAAAFNGLKLISGCSGNFTGEIVACTFARPLEIHSNDVSLYSCMAGRYFSRKPVQYEVKDPAFSWLKESMMSDTTRLATLMVLLDMLPYEKQNNPHRVRMWKLYRENFRHLVFQSVEKLAEVPLRLTSFFEGDVFTHFNRFASDPQAVFCCYPPTYTGGYEKQYKRLEEIIGWDPPEYKVLDEGGRDRLLEWLSSRRFVWYEDRVVEGYTPVMEQRGGLKKTVYLYSNVIKEPAFFDIPITGNEVTYPLAGPDLELTPETPLRLTRISTQDLLTYKELFLGGVRPGLGKWAFVVMAGDKTIGFLEFSFRQGLLPSYIYLQCDFPVPHTSYKRLSRLIAALALSRETRKLLERIREVRMGVVRTTAWTERPVSMKYRGVFDLVKRGETKEGEKFLNYEGVFNELNWQEIYQEWLTKYGQVR